MRDRNVVDAGRHADAEPGNIGRVAREIGAHVGDDVEIEREEAALVVEREPRGGDIVAAVAVAEEMLGALAYPFHRPAQPLGGNRGERIFAIGKQLGAEAAADVGRHHTHAVGRDAQHVVADDVADDVAALAAERERIALAVVFGDHAAGIHVVGHQPLIDDGQLDRARGLRERGLGGVRIAQLSLEGEIVRPVGPHTRRTWRERGHGADHMRQRLPVDRDRLSGVLRRGEAIGDHEGDGVADMAHHVLGQDRIDWNFDVHARQHAGRRQGPEIGHFGGGEHQAHARHRTHAIELVDAEAGMRMRRAQHHRVQRRGAARRRPRSGRRRAAARRLPCA